MQRLIEHHAVTCQRIFNYYAPDARIQGCRVKRHDTERPVAIDRDAGSIDVGTRSERVYGADGVVDLQSDDRFSHKKRPQGKQIETSEIRRFQTLRARR